MKEATTNKPIEKASVYLFVGKPVPRLCSTNKDGSFSFDGVDAGSRFLRVVCPGYMVCNQDIVIPRSQTQMQDVVITLLPATNQIGGCITNIDGKPVLSEVILLQSGRVISTIKSEPKTGAFQFDYLTAGFFELTANAPCYGGKSWRGKITEGKNTTDLVLTPLEGCIAPGICNVCENEKPVRYCKFCHAFICEDCRHNYPERVKAMLRTHFSQTNKSEQEIETEYEKLQKAFDAVRGKRCSACP